jgi:hypothetical protein
MKIRKVEQNDGSFCWVAVPETPQDYAVAAAYSQPELDPLDQPELDPLDQPGLTAAAGEAFERQQAARKDGEGQDEGAA